MVDALGGPRHEHEGRPRGPAPAPVLMICGSCRPLRSRLFLAMFIHPLLVFAGNLGPLVSRYRLDDYDGAGHILPHPTRGGEVVVSRGILRTYIYPGNTLEALVVHYILWGGRKVDGPGAGLGFSPLSPTHGWT